MSRPSKTVVVFLAVVATAVLVVIVAGHGRYWPWLALLALGGRVSVAVYAIAKRRSRA